jgi:hypothetical protein
MPGITSLFLGKNKLSKIEVQMKTHKLLEVMHTIFDYDNVEHRSLDFAESVELAGTLMFFFVSCCFACFVVNYRHILASSIVHFDGCSYSFICLTSFLECNIEQSNYLHRGSFGARQPRGALHLAQWPLCYQWFSYFGTVITVLRAAGLP